MAYVQPLWDWIWNESESIYNAHLQSRDVPTMRTHHDFLTGFVTALWIVSSYVVINVPYSVADLIPSFQKYKIQSLSAQAPPAQRWHAVFYVWMMILTFLLAFTVTNTGDGAVFRLSTAKQLPDGFTFMCHVLFCLFMEDLTLYITHRALHTKYLYAKIHKKHHEFRAPFSWSAVYAHPIEILFGNVFPVVAGAIVLREIHVFVFCVWVTVRLLITMEAHGGYCFPWSLEKWCPLWAGAGHHDKHHEVFLGNYSSSLTYLDYLCGTRSVDIVKSQKGRTD